MLGATFHGPWPGREDKAASVVCSSQSAGVPRTVNILRHPPSPASVQHPGSRQPLQILFIKHTLHLSLISDESPHMILSILKF